MIGVGAFTPQSKRQIAFEAAGCITSLEMQTLRMETLGEPGARGAVYDNARIREQYPWAELVRESINDAAPRPLTPYYNDLTIAIQRTWHPPGSVNPGSTPGRADKLISQALSGRVLL
jgi:multiple sugar transport system substrate-binding protein